MWQEYTREKDKVDYTFEKYTQRSSGKTYNGLSLRKASLAFSTSMGKEMVGKYWEISFDKKNEAILITESQNTEYSRIVRYTKSRAYTICAKLDLPVGRYYFKRKHEGGYLFNRAFQDDNI